jgi:type I restriction enzyme S subunit
MKILTTKSTWFRDSDLRLDASFHLSEGQITAKKIANAPVPLTTLDKETSSIFSGNIFKRAYVNSPEFGYGYLTGSDMMKSDINSGKFISKKYTKQVDKLRIGKHWILVSCSGTLGNVVFTNDDFTDKIGTHDLIRIIPSEDGIKSGYLYAYLASKYGYSLLVQSSYGGVIQHIEPHHIKDLPIPLLPDKQQEEIHQLIVDAAQLRVEANRLLREAVEKFENLLPAFEQRKFYVSNISQIKNNFNRLEATFLSESVDKFYRQINNSGMAHLKTIRQLSKTVFTPNIFKRVRVKDENTGVPFLSGSDLLSQMPPFKNFLSKKMKNIDDYILKEGWIAIQDSGTIGYVTLINNFLEGVSATNNLVRIVPTEENNMNYYIFCFFKTTQGQNLLKTLEYGSVQKHVDNNQISNFRIPIYDSAQKEISTNISIMHQKMGQACWLEYQAIQLIENEISTWQV